MHPPKTAFGLSRGFKKNKAFTLTFAHATVRLELASGRFIILHKLIEP